MAAKRRTPTRSAKLKTPLPAEPFYPFRPRSYQLPLLSAFSIDVEGTKRPRMRHGVAVWHRRAGKDLTAFAGITLPAATFRPGNYFHILPYYSQAKRAIWQEETTFLDRIPPHFNPVRSQTELYVEFQVPGAGKKSRIFLLGADDEKTVSRLVGTNPFGVVYSEAAQIDAQVRSLLRPALAENKGWEIFITTPRGKNWLYRLYQMALENEEWFAEILTVDQTRRDALEEDGEPVVPLEEIEADRVSNTPEETIQQEYYCSWEGYARGTIYGDLMRKARADGRIGQVPFDSRKPVGICMDIGRTDLTSIWFYQTEASAIRLIDYWAASGMDSASVIRMLRNEKPYDYARITLPHDAREKRFQTARYDSVEREFQAAFRCPVVVAERLPVQLKINAVRRMFPRFYFDEIKCGREIRVGVPSGLDSIGNYHWRYSEEEEKTSDQPVHDQFSHGADALAAGMVAWQEGLHFTGEDRRFRQTVSEFPVFESDRRKEQRTPRVAVLGGR